MATNDGVDTFPHSIEDLGLSARARNALLHNDILTVEQLCCTSTAHLSTFRNFGNTSLREVKRALDKVGLSVGCGRVTWGRWANNPLKTDRKSAGVPVEMMTMRDYLASKAMQGILAGFVARNGMGASETVVADASWQYADAMLSAREAKP